VAPGTTSLNYGTLRKGSSEQMSVNWTILLTDPYILLTDPYTDCVALAAQLQKEYQRKIDDFLQREIAHQNPQSPKPQEPVTPLPGTDVGSNQQLTADDLGGSLRK
jgi:hypothetical protein